MHDVFLTKLETRLPCNYRIFTLAIYENQIVWKPKRNVGTVNN